MTPLVFTLTEDMLVEAARIHNQAKWPRFVVIYAAFAALIGMAISYNEGTLPIVDAVEIVAAMVGAALAMCVAMFLLTKFWTIPHRVRQAVSHFDDLQQEAEWNDTHFQLRSSDGHSSLKFGRFAGWKQTPSLLMLYRTDETYYIIPMGSLTASGLSEDLVERIQSASVQQK